MSLSDGEHAFKRRNAQIPKNLTYYYTIIIAWCTIHTLIEI